MSSQHSIGQNRALRRLAEYATTRIDWPWGPVTTQRLARSLGIYLTIYVLTVSLLVVAPESLLAQLALGLVVPGAGFLAWLPVNPADWFIGPAIALASVALFAISMIVWFATGNVFLPPLVWLAMAIAAMFPEALGMTLPGPDDLAPTTSLLVATIPLATIVIGIAWRLISAKTVRAHSDQKIAEGRTATDIASTLPPAAPLPERNELSVTDLQRQRLLLDRALQPVEEFNGFDRRDQFQTAALRYQINFISYALAIAGGRYLPALGAYQATAQRQLAEKMRERPAWAYWQLETAWGHGSLNADPIQRENIMYSGFLALQLALARSVHGLVDYDQPASFILRHPTQGQFACSLPEITAVLQNHYANAPFGLLACEPNWIYPLCNAITVAGMQCADKQFNHQRWEQIKDRFSTGLREEFTTNDGQLVSCRSDYTGLALPGIGGITMQALPCLFFNSVLPELAERQWTQVRRSMATQRDREPFWWVDTGNYAISRASNYAATAAAAVEMGDGDVAERALGFLEQDHPLRHDCGIAYRDGVSIWAHATEFLARANGKDGLRTLIHSRAGRNHAMPYFKDAAYPDVLFARAGCDDGALEAVIHPGSHRGFHQLLLANLKPRTSYEIQGQTIGRFHSDGAGEAHINVAIHERTEIRIAETV